jgi:pimeloyl-ACP methyl ester carboxylesterase
MPMADNGGVRIHYEVSGAGRPFVFVHANPFDHRLWLYQVAQLCDRFRCISVDIRGYGRSDKPETPFTLADMKDDVLAVLRAEQVDRAIFCGCSVGSGMALLAALDNPAMVEALILVGGSSKGGAIHNARVASFEGTTDLRAYLESYIRELVAPEFPRTRHGRWVLDLFTANAHALRQRSIANIHRARGGCDMSGRLGEVRVPTLVVNGIHDNSLAGGRETAAGIAGARHVVLPNTGHACPIEDPDAFNAAVAAFLTDHGLWPEATL